MGIDDFVQESVSDRSAPLWWPGLAEALAFDRMTRLPFDPRRYSTSRFIADVEPAQTLTIALKTVNGHANLRIERMPPLLEKRFMDQGLPLDRGPGIPEQTIQLLAQSMAQIDRVPSLGAAVSALVQSIHLLTIEDPSVDVSFSDPEIPFSIFVSVSHGSEGDIRLAEAMLHESMHLQLSLVEKITPLVENCCATFYSPWKGEARPLSGIVHGLYVFRVIDKWLANIAPQGPYASYIARRRAQIAEEMQLTQIADTQRGLTRLGRLLVSRLAEV